VIKKVLFVSVLALSGCSSMERLVDAPEKQTSTQAGAYELELYKRSVHLFDPVSVDDIASSERLQPRLENLFILVDDGDDSELYRGVPKQVYVYEIFRRFNLSMPHLNLRGGAYRLSEHDDELWVGPYSSREVQHKIDLNKPLTSLGTKNLAQGIEKITELAVTARGRTGLVIFTDWQNITAQEVEAVARFRQRGEALAGFNVMPQIGSWDGSENPFCVFAVGVGNAMSRSLFDQADVCGFSEAADKVAQPRDMAYFVRKILFTTPLDSDGDGIYDYQDQCPDTPAGRIINRLGCLRFEAEE